MEQPYVAKIEFKLWLKTKGYSDSLSLDSLLSDLVKCADTQNSDIFNKKLDHIISMYKLFMTEKHGISSIYPDPYANYPSNTDSKSDSSDISTENIDVDQSITSGALGDACNHTKQREDSPNDIDASKNEHGFDRSLTQLKDNNTIDEARNPDIDLPKNPELSIDHSSGGLYDYNDNPENYSAAVTETDAKAAVPGNFDDLKNPIHILDWDNTQDLNYSKPVSISIDVSSTNVMTWTNVLIEVSKYFVNKYKSEKIIDKCPRHFRYSDKIPKYILDQYELVDDVNGIYVFKIMAAKEIVETIKNIIDAYKFDLCLIKIFYELTTKNSDINSQAFNIVTGSTEDNINSELDLDKEQKELLKYFKDNYESGLKENDLKSFINKYREYYNVNHEVDEQFVESLIKNNSIKMNKAYQHVDNMLKNVSLNEIEDLIKAESDNTSILVSMQKLYKHFKIYMAKSMTPHILFDILKKCGRYKYKQLNKMYFYFEDAREYINDDEVCDEIVKGMVKKLKESKDKFYYEEIEKILPLISLYNENEKVCKNIKSKFKMHAEIVKDEQNKYSYKIQNRDRLSNNRDDSINPAQDKLSSGNEDDKSIKTIVNIVDDIGSRNIQKEEERSSFAPGDSTQNFDSNDINIEYKLDWNSIDINKVTFAKPFSISFGNGIIEIRSWRDVLIQVTRYLVDTYPSVDIMDKCGHLEVGLTRTKNGEYSSYCCKIIDKTRKIYINTRANSLSICTTTKKIMDAYGLDPSNVCVLYKNKKIDKDETGKAHMANVQMRDDNTEESIKSNFKKEKQFSPQEEKILDFLKNNYSAGLSSLDKEIFKDAYRKENDVNPDLLNQMVEDLINKNYFFKIKSRYHHLENLLKNVKLADIENFIEGQSKNVSSLISKSKLYEYYKKDMSTYITAEIIFNILDQFGRYMYTTINEEYFCITSTTEYKMKREVTQEIVNAIVKMLEKKYDEMNKNDIWEELPLIARPTSLQNLDKKLQAHPDVYVDKKTYRHISSIEFYKEIVDKARQIIKSLLDTQCEIGYDAILDAFLASNELLKKFKEYNNDEKIFKVLRLKLKDDFEFDDINKKVTNKVGLNVSI
ncbi:MAG: hypothetical protein LBF68_04895 [Christensenellaceae bacterium]|jgi:hypothetical protein|nr:hypothetical protein [Christensenellaceae bacterium]